VKIGIISDSHDNLPATEQALEIMKRQGCDFLIHAGDICSPFIARIIKESGIAHASVFGNNDGDRVALSKMLDITPAPRHITIDNLSIVIFHEPFINDYIDQSYVDLLIYGHTHMKHTQTLSDMLILNPGTLSGVLADGKTFAIYDTKLRKAEIIEL
jgi:putative phosphoesterase